MLNADCHRRNSHRRWCAAVVVGLFSTGLRAQDFRDTLTLQLPTRGTHVKIACQIIDYKGETITVRLRSGNQLKDYPASSVVALKTPQTREHIQGLAALREGRFREARVQFDKALKIEPREWVRRDLLALSVRAALKTGEYSAAASLFLILFKSDDRTRHYPLAPLTWASRTVTAAERADTISRLLSDDATTKLIAASVLLEDDKYGDRAQAVLSELRLNTHRYVRHLARAQLWRVRVRGDIDARELSEWVEYINKMPGEIRGGPYYVLGQGYLKLREQERAAHALLWVPLVYDGDHHLAARAVVEAADALAAVGQQSAAITLYQEATQRFAMTPFAQDAAAELKRIAAELQERNPAKKAEQ